MRSFQALVLGLDAVCAARGLFNSNRIRDLMGLYPVTISSPIPPPPQPFTNVGADPNVFGLLDGVNTVFTTGVVVQRMRVYLNGQLMALTLDCSCYGDTVVFAANRVPQPGDTLLFLGWL